eukprot:scaffold879_cov410-Prasinococcus_capsulatus_cf.AAC.6
MWIRLALVCRGAVYAEASLIDAKIQGSDMRGAVFSRSVMPNVDLSDSDMSDAMFDYVVLRGASVSARISTPIVADDR